MRGVLEDGRLVGLSAPLRDLWPCRVLRFIQNPPRHKALSKDQASIMRSLNPGEDWGWCYIDDLFIEPFCVKTGLRIKKEKLPNECLSSPSRRRSPPESRSEGAPADGALRAGRTRASLPSTRAEPEGSWRRGVRSPALARYGDASVEPRAQGKPLRASRAQRRIREPIVRAPFGRAFRRGRDRRRCSRPPG